MYAGDLNDYQRACSYNVSVTLLTCPSGQVTIDENGIVDTLACSYIWSTGLNTCVPLLTLEDNQSVFISGAATGGAAVINIPAHAGSVRFTVQGMSSGSFYIRGSWFSNNCQIRFKYKWIHLQLSVVTGANGSPATYSNWICAASATFTGGSYKAVADCPCE
jgi:hypothetical protein